MKREDFDKNFDKNIVQLLNLLKKILKNHPKGASLANLFDPKQVDKINLNLCFFNFIPMSPEELDEFEEAYSEILDQDEDETEADFDWNDSDVDFLKRHGMSF